MIRAAITGPLAALLCWALTSYGEGRPATTKPSPVPGLEQSTLVVFNTNDPDSQSLAQFYAGKRGIAPERVVGLKCAGAEEITRQEYDATIAEPLRTLFDRKGWWKWRDSGHGHAVVEENRIRFIAIMRGMPLKIAAAANYAGDQPYAENVTGAHNEAAVDSELAVLAEHTRAISGAFKNPYFKASAPITEARWAEIMLVCRLDGPSPGIVRRMITDSLAAEKNGLDGFAYVDARGLSGTGLLEGDQWLRHAAGSLQAFGVPVIMDDGPATFPEGYPMRNAALYLGWYSEQPCGPFLAPGLRFIPGAVACHIHSFSGATVRDPKDHWVGPLLQQGAAAVLGNVYEPYLSLTTHLDVFADRLLDGYTFAEAAGMGQPVLSWMNVAVGDPLYRPFPKGAPHGTSSPEWRAYRAGAKLLQKDYAAGVENLRAAARDRRSGVLWEALGLLQMRASAASAAASFGQARQSYQQPEDQMRAALEQATQARQAGLIPQAIDIVHREAKENPRSPAFPLLQALVPEAAGAVIP